MASQQDNPDLTSELSLSTSLPILDPSQPHTFLNPIKRIHEGHDVHHFLTSRAYSDIGVFVMQLNIAMCPRRSSEIGREAQTWTLDASLDLSEPVQKLQGLLQSIDAIIDEVPLDAGPRRFGNVSFRKWYEILETRARDLLKQYLPVEVLEFGGRSPDDETSALDELTSYLLGGFGSAQRLDYGTGHELSFLAFLGCIWKLAGFVKSPSNGGELERSIVLGVIEPYVLLSYYQPYKYAKCSLAIYMWSVVLSSPILWNQLGLMVYGDWMIIHFYHISLDRHNIAQL